MIGMQGPTKKLGVLSILRNHHKYYLETCFVNQWSWERWRYDSEETPRFRVSGKDRTSPRLNWPQGGGSLKLPSPNNSDWTSSTDILSNPPDSVRFNCSWLRRNVRGEDKRMEDERRSNSIQRVSGVGFLPAKLKLPVAANTTPSLRKPNSGRFVNHAIRLRLPHSINLANCGHAAVIKNLSRFCASGSRMTPL